MKQHLRRAVLSEDGLTTVEYALLLVFMIIGAVLVWTNLGHAVNNIWWGASNGMEAMRSPGG